MAHEHHDDRGDWQGQHDADKTGYLTTGHHRQNATRPWIRSEPSPYALWVFVQSCAVHLENEDDRRLLATAANARLADPQADVSGLLSGLGPEAYALLASFGDMTPPWQRQGLFPDESPPPAPPGRPVRFR